MKRLGFTLVEVLIVVGLISILSVAVISVIDPKEQSNRAHDAQALNFATEIFLAIDRFDTNQNTPPFKETFENITLTSDQFTDILNKLVESQELKPSISNSTYFIDLIFSGQPFPLQYSLCFQPRSKWFKTDPDKCNYYIEGINNCFVCISNIDQPPTSPTVALTTPIPTVESTPTPTQDICSQTDYPHYPCTSFYMSDQFGQYGCDRFSVDDRSCNDFLWQTWNTPCATICQPGQRCLKKQFINPDLFSPDGQNCQAHAHQAQEYYCVSEPYANCSGIPSISTDYHFNFGCTNPIRAIEWKPEYL